MGADHRAFLDATLPYLDVVYQIARHAARDGQDPEDLVQETYLRAYAGFGTYRGGNARAWLAAICLNVARSEARRRRRRPWEVPAWALLDALPSIRADGGEAVPDWPTWCSPTWMPLRCSRAWPGCPSRSGCASC